MKATKGGLTKTALLARYNTAKTLSDRWIAQLQQCYMLTMPNYANFSVYRRIPGGPRTQKVFDSTAITGLKKFAANIQQMLMPNTTYWAKFKPGSKVMKENSGIDPRDAQIECDEWQKTFFTAINKSNFSNSVYQSLMEMGISTGVLLVQPGTRENPFKFKAVPLSQISVEQGAEDNVQTVFRKYRMYSREIQATWPNAKYSAGQLALFETAANEELEIIEGCVYEPSLPGRKKYCFFVCLQGTDGFIVKEYRAWSPWIIFRYNVLPSEQFGRGPILDLLPFIRELNQLAQWDLQAASFNANPIFLVASGSEINPYTTRINPGSIIPVQQIAPGITPIQQLEIRGQPTYSQLTRHELVEAVNEALNTNPIVPNTTNDKTAYEVQTRQAEWLRQNQAMVSRLESELCRQVVDKCWMIMHSLGLVPFPRINDLDIAVEFEGSIKDLQGQQEVQKAIQASQAMAQIGGPQMATQAAQMGYQIEDLPTWVLEKLHVDPKIVRSELSRHKIMEKMGETAAVQDQQQQAVGAQAQQLTAQAQGSQEPEGQI